MLEYNQDWFDEHGDELYDVVDQLQAAFNDEELGIIVHEEEGTITIDCYDNDWIVEKDDTKRRYFNNVIQQTCKKHPELTDAIVANLLLYALIKPTKTGKVNGEEIHNKYWTFQENIQRDIERLNK